MTSALVKPSKFLKGSVSAVGMLQDALNRAWEQYQAGIKREEANYFDRIKRIMAQYSAEAEDAAQPAEQPAAPEPAEQPAA
jgi:hypothetical protein